MVWYRVVLLMSIWMLLSKCSKKREGDRVSFLYDIIMHSSQVKIVCSEASVYSQPFSQSRMGCMNRSMVFVSCSTPIFGVVALLHVTSVALVSYGLHVD